MKKVIIFGMGKLYERYFQEIAEQCEVVAISDNDPKKAAYKLYIKPEKIVEQEFDCIVICSSAYHEIQQQLSSYGIEGSKIKYLRSFLEVLRYNLEKYVSMRDETSITDNFEYRALCKAAAEDTAVFDIFRSSVIYNKVLEHVSKEQGQEYLDIIRNNQDFWYDTNDWINFQQNDLYGMPKTYEYFLEADVKMYLSPTTIRYAKVLQDIVRLFDCKQIRSVAEIGIGYGGQARLAMDYLDIPIYYLIDIPEVTELASVFLNKFENKGRFVLCDGTQSMEVREYDFLISNYAFSELTRDVQESYMQSVILHSRAGYMIWNNLSNALFGGYSVEELIDKIPDSEILDEIPLTSPANKLIVWGRNNIKR